MLDLVKRHIAVWREAWALESEARKTKRRSAEADFLPASLEIMEKPPSPVGRLTMWLVIAFFTIALVWSYFGRIDVVAVAEGRVIPKGHVKVIQPAESGVVKAIHVSSGQAVKAGQILVELDPTFAGADEEQVSRNLATARVRHARATALIDHLNGRKPDFIVPDNVEPDQVAMNRRLIASRLSEFDARLDSYLQQRIERESDLKVVENELKKLREMRPLVEGQVSARRELLRKGLTPKLLYMELQERLVELDGDVRMRQDKRGKILASIASVDQQAVEFQEEFEAGVLTELAEAADEMSLQEQELSKARQRNAMQKLTAPVDGIVQQLAVHTIGGVVEPAQPLMVVVPGEGELIVEASLLNKDIGFVKEGDEVEVKLEAFPFTKYGVIPGTLEAISTDAVQDEQKGLIYQARISMDARTIRVGANDVALVPGMVAMAEVKTGSRRLIEFIMSPLLRYRDESMRER